jgi:nucleotide-binding universal stress UspA family protein
MYQKILCPVDGSKTSNRGLREACRLATALDSKLLLLHVLDNSIFLVYPPEVGAMTGYLSDEARKILDKAARVAAKQGVQVETKLIEIRHGRVAGAIVDAAKKARADMIVMGTHGRRGLGGLLLGSDAAAVVGTATVPVVLAK